MKQIKQASLSIVFSFLFFNSIAQPFRVQVAAYIEQVPFSYFSEADIFGVFVLTDQNNIYRYYIGDYRDKEEAKLVQQEAIKKGFKNARIIDIEEQRRLCGIPCPYFSDNSTYSDESTEYLTLQNIFFGFNQSTLSSEAKQNINKMLRILKQNPEYEILVSGHTDSKGPAKYNIALSKRRARATRSYLINHGIKSKRIKAEVFGESQPQEENTDKAGHDSPQGRKFNRRVVLAIYDPSSGQVIQNMTENTGE